MNETLIPADHNFGILAALLGAGAFALWSERTSWGSKLSAAVVAILTGMLLSNIYVIPNEAEVYNAVWTYFIPLAIPMLLFQANLKKIFRESGKVLIIFLIGTLGTLLGGIAAFYLVPLGEETWKLVSIFCATYIGGSMNFVGSAAVVGLKPGALMTAGLAADSLIGSLYFLVIYALPSIGFFKKYFPIKVHNEIEETDSSENNKVATNTSTLENLFFPLAISGFVCAVGFALAGLIEKYFQFSGTGILVITVLIVALANVFPKQLASYSENGFKLGMLLMQVFFVVVGAAANVHVVLQVGPKLILFVSVIILVHLLVILSLCKLFRLTDLSEILIASNANMGGPTTAAAMAGAMKWKRLITPAVLAGTLGYIIANFVASSLGFWLR